MASRLTFSVGRIIFFLVFTALVLHIPASWLLFSNRASITPCNPSFGSELYDARTSIDLNATASSQGTSALHLQVSSDEGRSDCLHEKDEDTEEREEVQLDATPYSLHPHGYAHYFFVQFSAYRYTSRIFFIVGLTSLVAQRYDKAVHQCEWHPTSSGIPLAGDSNLIVTVDAQILPAEGDGAGNQYVTIVVKCAFHEEVGQDGLGGLLFLITASWAGTGEAQRVVALQEKNGGAEIARVSPRKKPPFNVHFFFYDIGDMKPGDLKVFQPFIERKVLTITTVTDSEVYPGWRDNRLLFHNDCIHRSRFVARWTFFLDFDEFLNVLPPATISGILDKYSESTNLSFGSVLADPAHCTERAHDLEWPIQRMRWREKQPRCDKEGVDPWTCPGPSGHRKVAAINPQKIFSVGGGIPDYGVDLDANVARVHHYRGVLIPYVALCAHIVDTSVPVDKTLHPEYFEQFVEDISVPSRVASARNSSSFGTL